MGAVTFSINPKLVETLCAHLPLSTFVETGTFKGDTIDIVKSYFKYIYSIELSPEYYEQAKEKFEEDIAVTILQGDSAEVIKNIMPKVQEQATLYWLDAHWCVATNTAGEQSQCPLLAEIQAIKQLNANSIIVIDDARLFLTTPPKPHEITHWPSFDAVINALRQLSATHHLMVLNDCILFYPHQIALVIQAFAHEHGINWLTILDKSRDYDIVAEQLKHKDAIIQSLHETSQQLLKNFNEQQNMVAHLRHQVSKSIFRKYREKINNIISPKLGVLNLYPPRAIDIPKRYYKKTNLTELPSISIVTPSYNQGAYIERTINSILDQEYPNLEYIVQDGKSSDNTVEILQRYDSYLKYWQSEKDTGQSNAINKGFQHTTGDIMAYLNSDDILLPGSLHYVAEFFEKNPNIDVIYSHRVLIDEHDKEIGRWILPRHNSPVLSWADYIPQETLFWRRDIWKKAGGKIDESFCFAMDWDLLLRFREAGANFVRVPRFLGAFRIHSHQKTLAQISQTGNEEMLRLRERCLGRPLAEKDIRKGTKHYLNRHVIYHRLYRAGLLRY